MSCGRTHQLNAIHDVGDRTLEIHLGNFQCPQCTLASRTELKQGVGACLSPSILQILDWACVVGTLGRYPSEHCSLMVEEGPITEDCCEQERGIIYLQPLGCLLTSRHSQPQYGEHP